MSQPKHPAARPNVRMTGKVNQHRKAVDRLKTSNRRRLVGWLHEVHGDPVDELEPDADADAEGELIEGATAGDPADPPAEQEQPIDPTHRAMPLNYLDGLSEMDFRVVGALAHTDAAAARWEVHARHTGELFGVPATGHELTFTGMTFVKYADDGGSEEWTYWELARLMEQIGANP